MTKMMAYGLSSRLALCFKARYLITAVGLLGEANWPRIPKLESYKGELYQTAR
jgi:hypothetical protein